MKRVQPYSGFEQGPIRPPSEAESLLIRITRNCPWNRCTFCPVYKGADFSLRPVEHVLTDIDSVRFYVEAIRDAASRGQPPTRRELRKLADQGGPNDLHAFHAAYNFVAGGMRSIFLQDGNSLIVRPEQIIRILRHLKNAFPEVERITSYARSHTIARISDDNLAQMAEAGLNRIHIGMESGSDTVLRMVQKGCDKATHIRAGQKVKRAGMQLSEYFMPGLGGRRLSKEHALESADALNRINPDFIRLRTLALPGSAPLTDLYLSGGFDKMGEVETAKELLLFLGGLDGIDSVVKSDHVLNLFQEVDGKLPDQREQLLAPLRHFLELAPEEQLLFCIGRRTHRIATLDGLQDPVQRRNAMEICRELGATVDTMDQVIDTIMRRFI